MCVHCILLQAFGKFGEILKFFNTTALNSSMGWKQYNNTLEKFCQLNWTSVCTMYISVLDHIRQNVQGVNSGDWQVLDKIGDKIANI